MLIVEKLSLILQVMCIAENFQERICKRQETKMTIYPNYSKVSTAFIFLLVSSLLVSLCLSMEYILVTTKIFLKFFSSIIKTVSAYFRLFEKYRRNKNTSTNNMTSIYFFLRI